MNNKKIYTPLWDERTIKELKNLQGPILIVGGSGFIGASLFLSILNYREDVYACSRNPDRSWRFFDKNYKNLINIDITDYKNLKQVISKIKPMTVFNLSAYGSYARQTDTKKIHMTNYIGTLNLIRILTDIGCTAFVQAGSSSEYGLNCKNSNETSELIPNSDYAVSKVAADYLIKYYGTIYNFPCVNLRLYSIYGPWEERDRLVPTLIQNLLKGKFPNLVGRKISRDFVYIDDCNSALIRSAKVLCKTHPGISINIASGKKTTIEDIANIGKDLFEIKEEPKFGKMPNRKWDLSEWYGDSALAKELMDWTYKIDLKQGLKLTAEWEKSISEKLKYVYIAQKPKKISAILACYKDNKSIPVLYERLTHVLQKTGYDYEIIFVNDNSPANDEEVIHNLCNKDNKVIGISHSRNFGSQSAFLSGMEISTGDSVVLMDGDGQDPPEVIPEFIEKWNQGYDIVYGKRVKREAPYYMQIAYKLFYRIFQKLSNVSIPTDAGDFSLIDRKAVKHILSFPEKDVFLRGLRAWVGFKQTGVSYARPERLFGKSTNNLFKNIWWAKKGIFAFSQKPLYYIQSIGIFIFFITLILSVFYLTMYLVNPPANAKGTTTIILLLLGLGSFQIIAISILGDYIGKIMEESKNRPRFIRDKIIYNGTIYETDADLEKITSELKTKINP